MHSIPSVRSSVSVGKLAHICPVKAFLLLLTKVGQSVQREWDEGWRCVIWIYIYMAQPLNTSLRRASSKTKAKHKTTSLQGEHTHKQIEKSRRPRRSNCDSSGAYAHYYEIINPKGKGQVYSQATQERPYQLTSGRSCGSAYLSLHHFTPPRLHFSPRLSRNLSY